MTASWLVQGGVSLSVAQLILGHSTVRVTEQYAHLAPKLSRAQWKPAGERLRETQKAKGAPASRDRSHVAVMIDS